MIKRLTKEEAEATRYLQIYNRETEILRWLEGYFRNNSGYEDKVPFDFSDGFYTLFHIDTEFNKVGMTRFQGIILYKIGSIHYASSDACPPLELLKLAESYRVSTRYDEINQAICWTIWFKEPITQEIWDNQIKRKIVQ
jgi:hypothetical protein